MADRPLWHLKFEDKKYVFDPREQLTVSALRSIKQWFGPELGRYLAFISAFSQGDPEAALCALWLCRRAAGEQEVPEPNMMPDFPMGEFYDFFEPASNGDERPTQPAAKTTAASTETPTNSESSTSENSPTSATSRRKKSTSSPGSTS